MKKSKIKNNILKGIAREFAPHMPSLISFLAIAQIAFFTVGPKILISNITNFGLFLLNFVFAIIVPYNLAMVIKAIGLIFAETKNISNKK